MPARREPPRATIHSMRVVDQLLQHLSQMAMIAAPSALLLAGIDRLLQEPERRRLHLRVAVIRGERRLRGKPTVLVR